MCGDGMASWQRQAEMYEWADGIMAYVKAVWQPDYRDRRDKDMNDA